MKICSVLLSLLAIATPQSAPPELTIAAASDLSFAFKELAAGFEKETGTRVRMTFGSSGNFYSQIENGAPFDLYFSADIDYPRRLEAAGYVEPGSLYKYAVGRIVVWVPRGSQINVAELGMKSLRHPSVRKIAIANPRHAPYGRAAVAAMERAGIYKEVEGKLVLGENISQAAQFVESGSADIGIIALSLAVAPAMREKGRWWEIPESTHPPIEQGAAIVKASRNKQAAAAFLNYLKTPGARALMQRYGFMLPAEPPKTR